MSSQTRSVSSTFVNAATWNNAANVTSSDNSYADSTPGVGSETEMGGNTCGFAVPSYAKITGIAASYEVKASAEAGAVFYYAKLVSGTTPVASKEVYSFPATSDTVYTYGSSSDLWGLTWTPADINSDDFGLAIRLWCGGAYGQSTIYVDHMYLTVYYEDTGASRALLGVGS
jgi:hypothetical protein